MTTSDVKHNSNANRYELIVDGHLSVADYRRNGNQLSITHVEVPEALRGKGIAAQLMQGLLEDAKINGFTIVPVCPYAIAYMQRHKDTP